MAFSKNQIPTPIHVRHRPTTETAKKFKSSKMIGNRAQAFIALSPTLSEANEAMKRHGVSRMARNCIITQYGHLVNQPDMESVDFTFWTNEPASEQIIHTMDVDYPTQNIIEVLNGLSKED